MGSGFSQLTDKDMKDYKELTYLTQHEIIEVYHKFMQARVKTKRKASLREDRIMLRNVEEFKRNPFTDRLAILFSSHGNATLSFEDFLDLWSVLSPRTPAQVKAQYAFKMYDLDDDDMLSKDDLKAIIDRLTLKKHQREKISDIEMDQLIDNILKEADLDKDGMLSSKEFEHMILKTPDFASSFTLKV